MFDTTKFLLILIPILAVFIPYFWFLFNWVTKEEKEDDEIWKTID